MTQNEFMLGLKLVGVFFYLLGIGVTFWAASKNFTGRHPVEWWGLLLLCIFWPFSLVLATIGLLRSDHKP